MAQCEGDPFFKDKTKQNFTEEGNFCVVITEDIPKVSRLDFINLSFEDGDLTNPVHDFGGNKYWVDFNKVPGWISTNFSFVEIWANNTAQDGVRFLEINSDGADTVYQDATGYIVRPTKALLEYYIKNRQGGADNIEVKFEILSPFYKLIFSVMHTFISTAWQKRSYTFDLPEFAGVARISFTSPTQDAVSAHIDAITFTLLD